MRDPRDELLARLLRLRDIAQAIQQSVRLDPPPFRPDPTPKPPRLVTPADFHRAHRSLQ